MLTTDGTYRLKTLLGENAVRVRGPQVDKDPSLATIKLNLDVNSGDNIIPVDVKEAVPSFVIPMRERLQDTTVKGREPLRGGNRGPLTDRQYGVDGELVA